MGYFSSGKELKFMIRLATPDDISGIASLFHDTVRRVNSHDYAPAQIEAWAGVRPNEEKWRARKAKRTTFVDEQDGAIRGFAELEEGGHVGAVYVNADYQNQGIASRLLERIELEAAIQGVDCLYTEASITAQPFFERRGFETIAAQDVEYAGTTFRNYRMRKRMPNSE
jgi:putative acetyltransferase